MHIFSNNGGIDHHIMGGNIPKVIHYTSYDIGLERYNLVKLLLNVKDFNFALSNFVYHPGCGFEDYNQEIAVNLIYSFNIDFSRSFDTLTVNGQNIHLNGNSYGTTNTTSTHYFTSLYPSYLTVIYNYIRVTKPDQSEFIKELLYSNNEDNLKVAYCMIESLYDIKEETQNIINENNTSWK